MAELTSPIDVILRQKTGEVCATAPNASVYQAIEIMAEKQVGALLVIEQG